jgi:hypothetical protein
LPESTGKAAKGKTMAKMMTGEELGVLKAEALVLASKAKAFASRVRQEGHMNFHPDASDYDELAEMIRKLAGQLPC